MYPAMFTAPKPMTCLLYTSKELFAKVRRGKIRVLLGSTFKMGAGTNVQDKLIALHDLDCRATRS